MAELIRLQALDTGEVHDLEAEHAKRILKNDALTSKKTKRRNWKLVKNNKNEPKPRGNTKPDRAAEKPGDS